MSRTRWTKIAPGVYADGDGDMHVVVDELLEENGYEVNDHNRQQIDKELDVLAKAYGIPRRNIE